jgi:hypothetical protein
MSRFIWSVGGGGLLLAGLAAFWLRQPVTLSDETSEPARPTAQEAGATAAAAVPTAPAAAPPRAPLARPSSPSALVSMAQAPMPRQPLARARRAAPLEEEVDGSLATRLRRRIVLALRARHLSDTARRDAVLAEFISSGESLEPWTEQARGALERWRQEIDTTVLPIRAEPAGCYAAGCLARVTFPDAASYAAAQQLTPRLQLGQVGPHMQLPPEHLSSGEVVVSWAVLRPEAP